MAIAEKYATSAGAGDHTGASEAHAWSWAEALANAVAGDRINFKGNHDLAANGIPAASGSATSPIILRGYSSSIGDLPPTRTNSNGPLVATGLPVITGDTYYMAFSSYSFWIFESMKFTSAANGGALRLGTSCAAYGCIVENSGTGASAVAITNYTYCFVYNCDALLSGGSGGSGAVAVQAGTIVGCRLDGGPAAAAVLASSSVIVNCTCFSSGTDAIIQSAGANSNSVIIGCTLVGSTSDGFHLVTGPTRLLGIMDCLITDNGAYGIYAVDAASPIFAANNRLDRNTTADKSGATDWLAATSYAENTTDADQANEYEAAGSDDYRLKTTSPAKGVGFPPFLDIGSLQREEPAASGGGGLPILGGSVVR